METIPTDMENKGVDATLVPWKIKDGLTAAGLLLVLNLILAAIIALAGKFMDLSIYQLMIMITIATILITLFVTWFFTVRKYNVPFRRLGFADIKIFSHIPYIIIAEMFVFFLENVYAFLLLYLAKSKVPEQPIFQIFGRGTSHFIVALIVVALLAPISEEMFFRGFIYTAFRERYGVVYGVFISSGIFALFHVLPLLMVPIFIIGIALSLLYEYRKSLVAPIMLHALNNLLALLYLYYR